MVIALVYFVVAMAGTLSFARSMDRQLESPRLRAAWDGRTAEARCTSVRTEETQDAEGVPTTVSRVTLEFTAADGRTVSIEERRTRLAPEEGDFVTVYYAEDAPDEATARTPSFGLRHARAVITAFGSFFAVVGAVVLGGVL
ncbi:DUF3592 domain-containing protein [Streptomyces sp. NPDC001478]